MYVFMHHDLSLLVRLTTLGKLPYCAVNIIILTFKLSSDYHVHVSTITKTHQLESPGTQYTHFAFVIDCQLADACLIILQQVA